MAGQTSGGEGSTTINDSKVSELENNKIFEEKVLPEVVEGIEAKERTFIKHENEREIIKKD